MLQVCIDGERDRASSTKRGIGEVGAARPSAERLGRPLDARPLEPVRRRVRHVLEAPRRDAAFGGVEHVAEGETVADGQDRLLGPSEQRCEAVGEPRRGARPGLAPARAGGVGPVLPGPGAVGEQRATLERAEPDLVEERLDHDGERPAREREREGVLRTLEA